MQEKDNQEIDTMATGESTGQPTGENAGKAADGNDGQAAGENAGQAADRNAGQAVSENAVQEAGESEVQAGAGTGPEEKDEAKAELEALKAVLEEKSKKCDEYFSLLQRTAAEYDNYRKRTAKEKEALYADAVSDVVAAFLPVIDNIERALKACSEHGNGQSIKEGIELVSKQVNDVLAKLGVEQIKSVGEEFNPEVHNAVMHVEDENYGKNVVVEEFQKGYIYRDKVIRYSMVKVAN